MPFPLVHTLPALSTMSDVFSWQRCIFCQKSIRGVNLSCPANSKRSDVGLGYKTLANTISKLKECNQIPPTLNIHVLDEGDGIEATCLRNKACWHSCCKSKVLHPTAVERLLKNVECGRNDDTVAEMECDSDEEIPAKVRITRGLSGSQSVYLSTVCYFCEKGGSDLRQVMTTKVDERVRKCAHLLADSLLLGKLSAGDMIATEAKYHPGCLLALYDRASRIQNNTSLLTDSRSNAFCHFNLESLALAEIISYIEEVKLSETIPCVFKLSELVKLYTENLSHYDMPPSNKIHPSRFKERLLNSCPYLTATNHNREVFISYKEDVGAALHEMRESSDTEAVHMLHTVKLLRNAIFSSTYKFSGCFESDCQSQSIPTPLLMFINMLLEGPEGVQYFNNQPALSVSQLIIFNSFKQRRQHQSVSNKQMSALSVTHSARQEMPLPLYLGVMLHSATRKKKLVDKCCQLGLCLSGNFLLVNMSAKEPRTT